MKYASITAALMLAAWIIISLAGLWGFDFSEGLYLKLSISFALIAGSVFAIAMIRTEYVTGDMQWAARTAVTITAAWTLITLGQLWTEGLDGMLYVKLTVTMLLVGGGCVAVSLLRRNYLASKKLKDGGYID
jgi:hypothetical protein